MLRVSPISAANVDRLAHSVTFRDAPVRLDSDPASASPHSRWSYFPSHPTLVLQCLHGVASLRSAQGTERAWSDPCDALAWLAAQTTERAGDGPPFKSGWVGHLSYDAGRLFESFPAHAATEDDAPLFTFTFHPRVLAIDHQSRLAYDCESTTDSPDPVHFAQTYDTSTAPPRSDVTRARYEAAVQHAIDYIGAGDVFQVNLSQRFTAGLPLPPHELYAKLRRAHPAWFGAYLDYGTYAILSNSPELFLALDPATRRIVTRPIKGTRPRADGMADQLRDSAKDQAELNMIIDLERNDLGRVCQTGSVTVTEPRVIETHPTVYHGAATVEGTLRPDVTFLDVLRATFPGGSISGAPKIRAMQIIDELEPAPRGPYCGAIGFLSVDGHAQFNIAIRTMIARGNHVHFSVGAGIVADSTPAAEYDETLVKATAMLNVLNPEP